jgi:rhamnogalacturonan endolyase
MRSAVAAAMALVTVLAARGQGSPPREMEALGRGVVAIRQGEREVFVSWRLLGTDQPGTAFNVYRVVNEGRAARLNASPLDGPTYYLDRDADAAARLAYFVRTVVRGREQAPSDRVTIPGGAPVRPYLVVPLQTPEGYTPNDGSAGDLDGDGEYEIVVHQVSRGRDNSRAGVTGEPILQAYRLDGTRLWQIDLGHNIREGAHYTQFMVYDLDGDGRAEVACKTADGTVDGVGKVIGDRDADHRNESGFVLRGPEFLTIFDGLTGAALATADYIPPRGGDGSGWGDSRGNRVDRFLAAVAYLDGRKPSLVMARGYYTRAVLAAWNWRGGRLTHVWTFDSDDGTPGNAAYRGQGNHNLSVGDVDGDGRDEIVYGAAAIDDNGRGLHATGLGHGDAMHLSDLDPDRPGLEVFNIQERFGDAGANVRDARTGEVLWKVPSVKAGADGEGPGRGLSLDIDPRHRGHESWVAGAGITGLYNARGEKISQQKPRSCNFDIWWDGDQLRELLDRNQITKWNWNDGTETTLLSDPEVTSNNGTKATPVLSADILGDWREEVIWRTTDNRSLRIYVTTLPTPHRLYTLMHDPQYRLSVAWQNVAYNQPPHTGFSMGENMKPAPRPRIVPVQRATAAGR